MFQHSKRAYAASFDFLRDSEVRFHFNSFIPKKLGPFRWLASWSAYSTHLLRFIIYDSYNYFIYSLWNCSYFQVAEENAKLTHLLVENVKKRNGRQIHLVISISIISILKKIFQANMMKFIDHQTKLLPDLVGSTITPSFEVIHHPHFTNL